MQDRYTGDIGDIGDLAKYGLVRALAASHRLGVAWYLYPDESHNEDGRHVGYLEDPDRWRHLDPSLFDTLGSIVGSGARSVSQIEDSDLFSDAIYSGRLLEFPGDKQGRAEQRADWFRKTLDDVRGCDVVFADPDNGLYDDSAYEMGQASRWKSIPLSEAHVLSAGRTGIIYHHNTRFSGGHTAEIQHWLDRLGSDSVALYWRRIRPRTFFILHPTQEMRQQIETFAEKWAPHFELHTSDGQQMIKRELKKASEVRKAVASGGRKACPECGHQFTGKGWGGIDTHWKANHEDIMPYEEARPIIRAGGKPSAVGHAR